MNDYACILIWDAHTRMGHNNYCPIRVRDIPHTRMGQYTHMGQNRTRRSVPFRRIADTSTITFSKNARDLIQRNPTPLARHNGAADISDGKDMAT